MKLSFHPAAEDEFLSAIDYYEKAGKDLGQGFAADVYETVGRIVAHPNIWPKLDGEIRRCQTKRFPYGIIYLVENDNILILAVMHLHRHPDYWKSRKRP